MNIAVLYAAVALASAMMLLRPLVHWLLRWDAHRRDRRWARRRAYRRPGFIFDDQWEPQRALPSDREKAV